MPYEYNHREMRWMNTPQGLAPYRQFDPSIEDVEAAKKAALGDDPPDWEALENLHVPGAKDDGYKLPVRSLVLEYFPRALLAVAEISDFGAKKYTPGGWRTVENGVDRYGDAGARHALNAIIEGENDPETGMLHAAHEAWNALARLELMLQEKEDG